MKAREQNHFRPIFKKLKWLAALIWAIPVGLFLLDATAAAQAQTTTLYYKGALSAGNSPASGNYDFQFMLYDRGADGTQQGPTLTNLAVGVTNGVFNVTLDFGGVFDGSSRWLDISVRTNGNGAFTELLPRQEVFAVPYALYADAVGTVSGVLAVSNLPPTVALLTGNQVFTGTITAPSFNGALTGNSVVPDSALSSDVNLSGSANSQNGVKAYPPLNPGGNSRLPWLAYDSNFDPTSGCSPTAAGVSNLISQWATNGMRAAGFNLIVLDDGWQPAARPLASSQAMPYNTNTFPNGIAPLAAYAHQNGFQFMLYFSEGPASCCGLATTTGHEWADCAEAVSWGVDWIYIDFCSGAQNSEALQVLWESAIYKSGHPVSLLMSINNFGDNLSYGSELNGWVYGGQTMLYNHPSFFNDLTGMIGQALDTTNGVLGWPQQQSPGHFGVVGILTVNGLGENPCTTNQLRQALNAFAILASPISVDGTPLASSQPYLTNPEVLAIFKDPLCLRGQVICSANNLEIISKPLQNGAVAVAFINYGATNNSLTVTWSQLGIPPGTQALVHDRWLHADLGFYAGSFTATVAAQDISIITFTPQAGSVAAATIAGNLSVTNFNGGTNASGNSVLAGNGLWVAASSLWNPNALTNYDTRSLFFNGPVNFGGSVTFASPPVTNAATSLVLNSLVANYSVTNAASFDSSALFTPPGAGLYEAILAVTLTSPSPAAGAMQIQLQFANSLGSQAVNLIPSFDLTGAGGATASAVAAYEMTGGAPVSVKSILTGSPANQTYNVRCSFIRLQ